MTTATHILVGAAIGKVVVDSGIDTSPLSATGVILFAIFFSVIPDINIIWKKKLKNHHQDPTHYPGVVIVIALVIAMFEGIFLNNGFIFTILWLVSLLTHLFLDTFGSIIGVHWFWPFSKKQFSFTKINEKDIDAPLLRRAFVYVKTVGIFEIFVDFIAVGVLMLL